MQTTPEQAVQHCLDAYNKACAQKGTRDEYGDESPDRVNRAYRRAMPFLTPATIDAFLACVTHGLVLEIFTTAEAAKLLYATQIAVGSRRANQQQSKSASHQSQPPATPTPLSKNGAEGASAAPQVPAPQVPANSSKDRDKQYVEAMLERIFSGKPITQAPMAPWKKAPPTPSPLTKSGFALPTAS